MLLFIGVWFRGRESVRDVSIHLMLLFIGCTRQFHETNDGVSIHLMLLFIRFKEDGEPMFTRFNTSHVTLYRKISKNLDSIEEPFQYISCYSLSRCRIHLRGVFNVSIHLMLLFIVGSDSFQIKVTRFQYISCYSLSKH